MSANPEALDVSEARINEICAQCGDLYDLDVFLLAGSKQRHRGFGLYIVKRLSAALFDNADRIDDKIYPVEAIHPDVGRRILRKITRQPLHRWHYSLPGFSPTGTGVDFVAIV